MHRQNSTKGQHQQVKSAAAPVKMTSKSQKDYRLARARPQQHFTLMAPIYKLSRPSTPSATDDSTEELSKADNVNVDVLLDHDPDPSNWPCPNKVTDLFRIMLTENGPPKFPDGPFPRSQDCNRCFTNTYYYRWLTKGE